MSLLSAQGEAPLLQAVLDRYRCPDRFLSSRLIDELAPDAGYFEFGSGTTCFGRTVNRDHREETSSGSDTLGRVFHEGTQLVLPFDPNEVIDNLRLERYPSSQLGHTERALKSIYYWLRPLTNRALRKAIQRIRAADWQERQFPQWPVDTTVECICEKLLLLCLRANGVSRIPFIWFWPDGARGCISMTHDVETVQGRNFCERLLDIDDSFGIKASYQLVPEGRYAVMPELLSQLRMRGCEVCLQDLNHDGRLFDDRKEFERRAALINRYGRDYGARGFRSAVLYRNPDWYAELDFSFDMSIPNVATLDPQRGGCCTVFPYFIGDILELPVTTIQDYSLFHVLNERSIDLWKTQLEMILARNGLASFIVHPDYIVESDPQEVYCHLLDLLVERGQREGLWFALPSEIDTWWRARSRMSIVNDNGSWRIVGEGAEHAVLGLAEAVDGQLICKPAAVSQGELMVPQAK